MSLRAAPRPAEDPFSRMTRQGRIPPSLAQNTRELRRDRGLPPRARQLTPSALGGFVALVSFYTHVKRALVGAPIPSHRAHHERFSRTTGLAVLSSDPLSSVAYATEEILRVLTVGGVAALWLVTPIGAVIAAMLGIV